MTTIYKVTYKKLDGSLNTLTGGSKERLQNQIAAAKAKYPNHDFAEVWSQTDEELMPLAPMTSYERWAGRQAEAQSKWSINNR